MGELRRSSPEQIREWRARSKPLRRGRPKPGRNREQLHTLEANKRARYQLARGWCEAEGMHHENCPGRWVGFESGYFLCHHVLPEAKGGDDRVENLRYVWNGWTPLGRGGCHGMIHDGDPGMARDLGLLIDDPEDWDG